MAGGLRNILAYAGILVACNKVVQILDGHLLNRGPTPKFILPVTGSGLSLEWTHYFACDPAAVKSTRLRPDALAANIAFQCSGIETHIITNFLESRSGFGIAPA
jgi:hypothetical protein